PGMRWLPRLSDIPRSMSEEEFWTVFGRLEHEQLDFKESANHLTAGMAAMSMSEGGMLVVGVSDARELKGCSLDQRTFDAAMRAAHGCKIDVAIDEITVDGTALTVVAVPEIRGRIVTTPDGRLLRRVGSDNQPLI